MGSPVSVDIGRNALRRFNMQISKKSMESSQPLVSGRDSTVALFLKPFEEAKDSVTRNHGQCKLVRTKSFFALAISQEKHKSVTVGHYRIGAGAKLPK